MNRTNKYLVAGAVLAGALALVDALVLEQYFFEVKEFEIGSRQRTSEAIKILHLTDLHLGKVKKRHKKLAATIHKINPDIIFITGDALDQHGKSDYLNDFLALLPLATPKAAILGNHDHKAEASTEELRNIYQAYNADLLMNESKAYTIKGYQIMVSGLDDFIKGKSDFYKAVRNVGREKHHFTLIHSPLQQEEVLRQMKEINAERTQYERLNISYLFAGHNHGGQVTLLGLAPYMPKKSGDYLKGWYNTEKPYLYVSKGYGTSTVPFRFGARAEITLFYYYI